MLFRLAACGRVRCDAGRRPARKDRCRSPYLITLKNARAYEARDVRVNGLPLTSLNTIVAPGRLEFVALPAARSGPQTLGNFKSMCGIDVEFDISYPEIAGRRCTLGGRVTSAVVRPGSAAPSEPRQESVTFVYERIIWP